MPGASKATKLSSLFRSAVKATSSSTTTTLNHHVASSTRATRSIKPTAVSEDSAGGGLRQHISNLLRSGTSSSTTSLPHKAFRNNLDLPWVQSLSQNCLRKKENNRVRKHKSIYKGTQERRFGRLVNTCAEKLGTDTTLHTLVKLGRGTRIKEFNALIGICVKEAKKAKNEVDLLDQIYEVDHIFKLIREQGFQLQEETYGQFLTFLIDTGMVEEFKHFCKIIGHENPNSLPRLAYYEMLLLVRLGDKDNIKKLCDTIATNEDANNSGIRENYFLAFCESERRKEVLILLDNIDITQISSMGHLATVLRSLGRLSLETSAKKLISQLKSIDMSAEDISKLIYDYAISVPNITVEDTILKFESWHEESGLRPASASYEKLIKHCCTLLKVHTALDIVDHMFEEGLSLSLETFHLILQTCEESCDFNLVHRIYAVIRHTKLKPNSETFRIMIFLSVRMKDFEGAQNMIKDMKRMNVPVTTNIYNIIMSAHFREKNIRAGLQVLNEMEKADLQPDSLTFCSLIENCDREEDIITYYENVKLLHGLKITKHVFMALINAYASRGQFEKAKQVVLEEWIPEKNLDEVKSVLVSALASHGRTSDALSTYEEIKRAGSCANSKAILCLIENLRSKVQLSKLLDLLENMNDRDYWIEGCFRVILYCVECKDLRSTIDLMKQLMDKLCDDVIATEALFDEAFCKIAEMEHVDLQFGLELLQSIKEKLGIRPSRRSLDFLLCACACVKDSKAALVIWKEYAAAGLPCNELSYLRMYQVYLACGDHVSARRMLKKILLDDPHVRCVVKACQAIYDKPKKKTKKEKSRLYGQS